MKYKFIFLFFLMSFAFIFAQGKKENDYLFEVKPAYFYFNDNTARDIYGKGGFMPSLEWHGRIYDVLFWFFETGVLYKDGHNYQTNTDCDILLFPMSLGFKLLYSIRDDIQIYGKIAPNWIYVKTWSDYGYLKKEKSDNQFGATFGIGLTFLPHPNCAIDFFAGYLFNRETIKDKEYDLKFKRYFGGFPFGIGLGYSF